MIRLIVLVLGVFMALPLRASDLSPGLWRLQSIDGAAFSAQATLQIGADGRIGGRGPCNSWNTRGTADAGLLLAGIMSTKRACDALPQENDFFQALSMMSAAQVSDGLLILTGQGREMIFAPSADQNDARW